MTVSKYDGRKSCGEPHMETFSWHEISLEWRFVLIVNIIMLIQGLSFSYHLIKLKLNGDHKIVENVLNISKLKSENSFCRLIFRIHLIKSNINPPCFSGR